MNAQHMKIKWRTPSTMNTNHTSLYDGDDASGYTKPLFDIVGKGHEEKARHIADCVNACAGIVNPEIKIPQLKDALIEAVEQLQKAEQQNAELRAVLELFVNNGGLLPEYEFDHARKLIAIAKAGVK